MRAHFDDLTFDAGSRELSRSGTEIRLQPKAFQLLEMLISRAPEAVSQEEIYDSLWPDTIVNLANLHNLVLQVRTALGEGSRSRIRTIYGYGFSFAGELEISDAAIRRSAFQLLIGLERGSGIPQDLHEGDNSIGREEGADVRLLLPSISRRHAIIRVDGETASVEDLGSKNGTWVDAARVESVVVIDTRSHLQFGHVSARLLRSDTDESTITEISREL